jgi:PHP domain-containing protein
MQVAMTANEFLTRLGMPRPSERETPLAMFHLHTQRSHDSTLHPRRYAEFAKEHRVALLCITDHGTTEGAREVARYLADAGISTIAPIGMEAYAKEGHIGCLGIQQTITARLARDIVKEVREQGGLTVYNHPYQYGRTADMQVAELVDCIEYPNNRTSAEDNFKALQLAIRLKKPVLPGADVHQSKEMCQALVHLMPGAAELGMLATPLPANQRSYYDKLAEVLLKTLKNRKPDYVVGALRHLLRKVRVKHGVA